VVAGSMSKAIKLVQIGAAVAVLLPPQVARTCNFKAGSFVRLVVLQDELRVRPVASPRAYDLESLDDYRERMAKAESDRFNE
jgi:antitoxin component of MazEF toxin-antitoxin module